MPAWKRLLIAWLFVPVHAFLFRLSGGRVLGRLEGTGVLILVTMGRKSGKRRLSPLLYFRFDETGDLVVVASNYGQDRHPTWYLNLAADPRVVVETGGERFAAEAHVIRGHERDTLYDRVVAANPRFGTYRAGTRREIPVVALRRARPSVRETSVGGAHRRLNVQR
ncbi:MAG: nitroreductase/quinone reductase family protein [Deltaproteobacteria bacterium]|nr:nitroreductase/quinone reductase family protein [Deltaproteobacteria bacterium]